MIESNIFSVLVTQTWQVAAVAMVVLFLARTVAKNRPHLAHALWLLVLLKVLTPPVWSAPTSPFSWLGMTSIANPVAVQEEPLGPEPGFSAPVNANTRFDTTNHFPSPQQTIESAPLDSSIVAAGHSLESGESIASLLPVPSSPIDWSVLLTWLWIAGAIAGATVLLVRYSLFIFWIRRTREIEFEHVSDLARQLSSRLGIRSRVRVKILESPVGPVVLGLFRPTVVLPAAIVRGKSADELAPLLAHELIHFRRGDLWWALLQALAKNLLWFHPLVHLAERRVTREAERSCDEETIASLGCSPAAYARCLLGVLEQKHQLRVAPALPGVRTVDITSARLERVMKLGNGIHQKSPAWVWLVLLLGCAIVMPGARWIVAQEAAGSSTRLPAIADDPAVAEKLAIGFQITIAELSEDEAEQLGIDWKPGTPLFNQTDEAKPVAKGRISAVIEQEIPTHFAHLDSVRFKSVMDKLGTYGRALGNPKIMTLLGRTGSLHRGGEIPIAGPDGSVFVRRFGTEVNLTPTVATPEMVSFACEIELSKFDKESLPNPDNKDFDNFPLMSRTKVTADLTAKQGETVAIQTFSDFGYGKFPVVVLITPGKPVALSNGVQKPPSTTERQRLHAANPQQIETRHPITLETHFIRADLDEIEALNIKWDNNIPSSPRPEKSQNTEGNRVDEKPTMYAVIDNARRAELIDKANSQANWTIDMAPCFTTHDGEPAEQFIGEQTPFVTDAMPVHSHADANVVPVKTVAPVVVLVKDGINANLTPTLLQDGKLRLDCELTFSKVVGVTTIDAPNDSSDHPFQAQKPHVQTRESKSIHVIPRDRTLVMLVEDLEKNPVLVLVKCRLAADSLNAKSRVTITPRCVLTSRSGRANHYQFRDLVTFSSAPDDIIVSVGQKQRYKFSANIPEFLIEKADLVKLEIVSASEATFTGLKPGESACTIKLPDGSTSTFAITVTDELLPDEQEAMPTAIPVTAIIGGHCGIHVEHQISDYSVADENLLEVEKVNDQQLLLKASTPGNTTVIVKQKNGQSLHLHVSISGKPIKYPGVWATCDDDDRDDPSTHKLVTMFGREMYISQTAVFEEKDGTFELKGRNLVWSNDDQIMMSAEFGTILTSLDSQKFNLLGNAKFFCFGPDFIMEADQINCEQTGNQEAEVCLEMKSNARMSCPKNATSGAPAFDATADRVLFDGKIFRLIGNASVIQTSPDGKAESFEGSEIQMSESGEVKIIEQKSGELKL